ncbi:MAG: DUF4387 domain-containing protein [Hyphomonadaceae bacterium]
MATVKEVCHHLRSKNAGPFWVTIDLFFDGDASFEKYAESPRLGPALFADLYGADPALVKRFPVASLHMVKFSYPRTSAQGGEIERDMHSGQQFVRLLDVELD